MSGVPMSSDTGHAFSGGALSEREKTERVGLVAGHDREQSGQGPLSRSESVTHHEAAPALGGTGEYRVLELPRTVEVARFPTLEAAQAYALSLNEWLAARPSPDVVRPFFAPEWPERAEPSFADLEGILARGERPERMRLA